MRFKKIYIEITNCCNFNCSFCFKTARKRKFMSLDEFQIIVDKIRPFTNYIYLHVLGEPLLHPQFEEILTIAKKADLNVNITTNGGLIEKQKETLLKHSIRQVNISLHDAEENIKPENWENYLNSILDFSVLVAEKTYISLRLWNSSNKDSEIFNDVCLSKIASTFNLNNEYLSSEIKGNGLKLSDHIFLQRAPRFDWPDEKNQSSETKKTCYALRDHIAILADGQVVPCCLDADANLKLGDIFTEELGDILEKERSRAIKKGFQEGKAVEPFCSSCGFSKMI
ncbi:MAG: radical SAM protein [Paludibacter sp.]|nr:radical SAM protein [Paludibacter sp.]